jgi:UDP-N-acetylmuramate--alanine ligase
MNRRVRTIHLVGIGGAGMSGIAEILQASGYTVTGSDLRESETVSRLRGLGIEIFLGHDPTHIGGADVVVYSSAVSRGNPELVAAESERVPVIPRAEMLAELMRMKQGIAVAGSHGKTTTTSLISAVLQAGGLDPTCVVGGRVKSLGSHSRFGTGEVLVAEADESDGSFLRLLPTLVVITNVDAEHLDHYGTVDSLHAAFVDFANRIPFHGSAIVCLDDGGARSLLPRITRRTLTYGLSVEAELTAEGIAIEGIGARFRVRLSGETLGEVRIRMPGTHNVQNALAAIAVGIEFEVPWNAIAEGLDEFSGVERRFEARGERGGVLFIDDYAHHPSEIRATLRAARSVLDRRLVVVFQPHRYTRTRDLLEEFARAFGDADVVILTEIYPAGEAKLPGVDGRALADALRSVGNRVPEFVAELSELPAALESRVQPGDAVFFLGAGDVNRWIEPTLDRLGRGESGGETDD